MNAVVIDGPTREKLLGAGTYDFTWMAEGDPTEHKLGFRLV